MHHRQIAAALAVAALAGAAHAQVATINGAGTTTGINGGFGNVIGSESSMDITTLADGTVNMSLNRGGGGLFDLAVIYIDTGALGVSNTSVLGDTQDGGRAGISGNGFGGESSDLGFAPGFSAAFAITIETAFSGLFNLTGDPNDLGFVAGVSTDGARDAQDASFNISFNMSQLGLAAGDSFRFVMTYLNSGNAFRSDEFHGVAQSTVPGGNIGQNPIDLAAGDYVLVNTIPAPGAVALLGLGGLCAARRRR